MRSDLMRPISRGALSVLLPLLAASTLAAQNRLVLPEGSVIIVRTTTPLESSTARVGQSFETTVADSVGVDNYTVVPAGSRIQGVVTFAQAANRQQSGVIQVDFNRLTLSDGTAYQIDGRLTSTDAAERRQIESDPNSRVVLVGGRGGIGAVIAGAGSENNPVSGILGALGGLLSEGRDVRVPAGTPLAVQLDQQVILRSRGRLNTNDAFSIYTSTEMIRAAQQSLSRQGYYRGSINGQLDDDTQRALFDFQVARGMVATGNLNGLTVRALGISTTPGSAAGTTLSVNDASLLRRGSQALVARFRQDLSISAVGRLDTRREYSEGDLELWFALSAFSDNSALYEQVVRMSANTDGSGEAGQALVAAAQRVDAAMQHVRPSIQVQNAWGSIRRQLAGLESGAAFQR